MKRFRGANTLPPTGSALRLNFDQIKVTGASGAETVRLRSRWLYSAWITSVYHASSKPAMHATVSVG